VSTHIIYQCFSISCIAKEEIFGPVLAIQTFRTTHEVINKANNTPYGLSAGVWTDKGSKVLI
jgi:aldehyde dehydrogenase (NAD+)